MATGEISDSTEDFRTNNRFAVENENLYNRMRDRVVGGEFEPGQRLRAKDLRGDYGVSASTMREILFRLSTAGLVDFQEQRGFRLPNLATDLRNDLTRFRILLECEGACLSIRNGGVAWEARLAAAHHALRHIESRVRSGEPSKELLKLWVRGELDFHKTLISACGNAVLKQTHEAVYFRFRQQLIKSDSYFTCVPRNIEDHRLIVEAALKQDEVQIRQRIHDHLSVNLVDETPDKERGAA